MEAKHTPGPWTAVENGIIANPISDHGNFYVACRPFQSEEATEQDEANLRLIAAAPEMLETLKNTELYLLGMAGIESADHRLHQIFVDTIAAIRKATGE